MNNNDRANSAKKALDVFIEDTCLKESDLDEAIADLLCDLQHFARQNDIDYLECQERADRNYATEIHDDDDL